MTNRRPTISVKQRRAVERARSVRRARHIRIGIAIVAIAALAGIVTMATRSGVGDRGVTDPARFDLPTLDGKARVTLASLRGTPVIVNMFASWCTACDAELPGFSRVSADLRGMVRFVGVNSLETGDRWRMPRRHGITWWTLARDVGGSNGSGLHDAYGARGMPVTAFYATDGTLRDVVNGTLSEAQLRAKIHTIFGVDS